MTDPELPIDDPEPDEEDGDGGGDHSPEEEVLDVLAPRDEYVGED